LVYWQLQSPDAIHSDVSTFDVGVIVATTWPHLHDDTAKTVALCGHIAQCDGGSEASIQQIGWAWLAAAGDARAVHYLEDNAFAPALRSLKKNGYANDAAEDAVQIARMELLVGANGSAGLLSFRGRSSLAAFVYSCVLRRAIDLFRKDASVNHAQKNHLAVSGLVAAVDNDPLALHFRALYGNEFESALLDAWHELPAHHRFVLSLLLHHRLAISDVARIYNIHIASAARRCASARCDFVALTRDKLRTRLSLDDATVDSILRLVSTTIRWSALQKLPADNASNQLPHEAADNVLLIADEQ
jgi:RNA polymerase sigma-70 factor